MGESIRGLDMESIETMVDNIEDSKPEIEEETISTQNDDAISHFEITQEMKDQELENLKSQNYLELQSYRKRLYNTIEELKSTKEAIESMKQLQNDMNDFAKNNASEDNQSLAKEIEKANAEVQTGMENDEVKAFLSTYDERLEWMNECMKVVDDQIAKFDDTKKTTTFMSNSLIEILDKKIDGLKDNPDKRYKKLRIFYTNIKSIYENRDSLDYIKSQIDPCIPYLRRVILDFKKEKKNKRNGNAVADGIIQNVSKTFGCVFSFEQLNAFENYIKDLFHTGKDDYDSFLFQYMLYVIYVNEKKKYKGYHKWVEVLIMNTIDILSDNYDLESGKEVFDHQLLEIRDILMQKVSKL